MRTDDILDQIDTALHDHFVSGDAMRSRPAPEPGPEQSAQPQVLITSTADDPGPGGWVEIGYLDESIDQATTDPAASHQPRVTWDEIREWLARIEAERARRAREMLEVLRRAAEAVRPAAEQAGQAFAELAQTAQQRPAPPGRRTDRPAWQSPYGPARRRH